MSSQLMEEIKLNALASNIVDIFKRFICIASLCPIKKKF